MKIIKYQLATEINHGTPEEPDIETVLSGVTMPYTEASYAIAQTEAYQGQITVEDDGRPEPEPGAEDITLDMLADHEERLCMLELTTTTVWQGRSRTMTTVYNLCKLLIDRGRTEGLQEKMDVYLAADRLTPEEYSALSKMLTAEAAE